MTPAIGLNSAASGIRVGSVPVTSCGPAMLMRATAAQIVATATVSAIQLIRSPACRSPPISTKPVASAPHSQSAAAAIGRCSCAEPVIKSGLNALAAATASQIDPTTAMVHRNGRGVRSIMLHLHAQAGCD
jgi:hypothetical protein